MGHGKIGIQSISYQTNRKEVKYPKRMKWLLKKAKELSIICTDNASTMNSYMKLFREHSVLNPCKEFKELHICNSHFRKMHDNRRKLIDVNADLSKEKRQWWRERKSFNDLTKNHIEKIDRKCKVVNCGIELVKKKMNFAEQIFHGLLVEYEARQNINLHPEGP